MHAYCTFLVKLPNANQLTRDMRTMHTLYLNLIIINIITLSLFKNTHMYIYYGCRAISQISEYTIIVHYMEVFIILIISSLYNTFY